MMVDRDLSHERTDPSRNEMVIAEGVSFADFLKHFGDQQAEWLMGKVIRVVSNNTQHNTILVLLTTLLNLFLSARSLGRLLSAGVPMYISDKQPAREPDLLVVLNPNISRIKSNFLEGAADLVVEVVSPESSTRDRGDKFDEYEAAGVPEYWLLDPKRKESSVYVLGDDHIYHLRPLDAQGRLNSAVLPGFAVHPDLLWQETPPTGAELLELVRQMVEA
jgi:Uma2 family endonuclease